MIAVLILGLIRALTFVLRLGSGGPDAFDVVARLAVEDLPPKVKLILNLLQLKDEVSAAKWFGLAAVGLALFAFVWTLQWPHRFDFFIFSPFDDGALRRIGHKTGLLKFKLATENRAHWRAQRLLLRWVHTGAGHRPWGPFWRKPSRKHLPQPFSWIVLSGPTGVGKTQAALELGRHLARRQLHGGARTVGWRAHRLRSLRVRLRSGLRRLLWWSVRPRCEAWDAGLLASHDAGRMAALASWRPRRPTLLVLDDPQGDASLRAVQTLAGNADAYWHPVRLLIVDRWIPERLGIKWDPGGDCWDRQAAPEAAEPVLVGEFAFDEQDIRRVQFLDGRIESKLRTDEDYEFFVRITGGNPMLVAIGLQWLETVDVPPLGLTSMQDILGPDSVAEGRHHILNERVRAVFRTLDDAGFAKVSALKAIACATLAQGISLEAAQKTFGFDANTFTLQSVFPHPSFDSSRTIPPIRPACVGELLILKYLIPGIGGNPTTVLEDIVAEAWRLNPSGVWHTIERHSSDATGDIRRVLLAWLESNDPAQSAVIVRAAIVGSARGSWDLSAIQGVAPLLANVEASDVDILVSFFEESWLSYGRRTLPALAIYCVLARYWLESSDAPTARAEHTLTFLSENLQIAACQGIVGSCADEAFGEMLAMLIKSSQFIPRLLFPDGEWAPRLRSLQRCLVERIPRDLPLTVARACRALADAVPKPERGPDVAEGYRVLWRRIADDAGGACQRPVDWPSSLAGASDATFLTCIAWTWLAWEHCSDDDDVDAPQAARKSLAALDALAAHARPTDIPYLDLGRARTWRYLATAYGRRCDVAGTVEAVQAVLRISAHESHLDDREYARAIGDVYQSLACVRASNGDAASALDAALKVQAITDRYPISDRDLQLELAVAWRAVAYVRDRLGDAKGTVEAARVTEEITERRRFVDDRDFRRELAWVWQLQANVLSKDNVDAAARIVRSLRRLCASQDSIDDEVIHQQLALAIRNMVVTLAESGDVAGAVENARALRAIAGRRTFAGVPLFQRTLTNAWGTIAHMRCNRADIEGTFHAAQVVQEIASRALFKDDVDIQRDAARSLSCLAVVSGVDNGDKRCRDATNAVDEIASRAGVGDDEFIQVYVVMAWTAVAAVCSNRHDVQGTRDAQYVVEKAATRPRLINRHDVHLWRVQAWGKLIHVLTCAGDLDGATDAIAKLESVAMRGAFAGDPEIENELEVARKAIRSTETKKSHPRESQ